MNWWLQFSYLSLASQQESWPWISVQPSSCVAEELKGRTSMSRQAAFRSVIWSAMVSAVKPGTRLANSTILIMHLVASSLNLSHRPRSSLTRWSALEFCKHKRTDRVIRREGGLSSEAAANDPLACKHLPQTPERQNSCQLHGDVWSQSGGSVLSNEGVRWGGWAENEAPRVGLSFLPVLVTGSKPMLHSQTLGETCESAWNESTKAPETTERRDALKNQTNLWKTTKINRKYGSVNQPEGLPVYVHVCEHVFKCVQMHAFVHKCVFLRVYMFTCVYWYL